MQELLDAVREEASAATWSQGVRLSRSGTLQGKRTEEGDLEIRIATTGGMVSPLVVLSMRHGDWSCECPSGQTVCHHVAAAVITLHQAEREGRDLLGVKGPGARVHYAFGEQDGRLTLTRMLSREGELSPLPERLARAQRKPQLADVATTRADLEIDILLGPEPPGALPSPYIPKLLAQLVDSDQVSLDGEPIEVGEPAHVLCAVVRDCKEGFEVVAGPSSRATRSFSNGAVVVDGKLCAEADPLSGRDLEQLRKGKLYTYDQVADLVGRVLPALEQRLPVEVRSKVLPTAQAMEPRISLSSESVDGQVRVLATLVYGDPPVARVDAGRMTYLGGALPLRDSPAEARLVRELKYASGLEVGRPQVLEADKAMQLASRMERLGNVHFSGAGLAAFRSHGALEPSLQLEGGDFDLRFRTAEGSEADADAVLSAWRAGSPLVPLANGGFAELPADFLSSHGHILLDLMAARAAGKEANGHKRPSAAASLELARLYQALDQPPPPQLEGVRTLLQASTPPAAPELPADLTASLRDYQVEGVRFMRSLQQAGLGALLADDMGLGKTLQALCVVESPTLVVCPASVLFNWRQEIEHFRPALKAHTFHGPRRELDDSADVTLTTYAILRLDRELLASRDWRTVILDEAQTIKNPESQVAQAAYAQPATFRLALTGTPVENRLEDLWSQMHFLNPGLLGGRRDFQERYAQPIADGDPEASARLRRRIKPLLLRRLKSQVAAELPPRTDLVLRCALEERERALYDTVRAAAREQVVEQLGEGNDVLAALEALLRLRQACCHPGLLPGQQADDSSKLRLLRETLEEVISEGHKALVFSQWTSLLDLVEPGLKALGIQFVRLDGSTRDRGAVVEQFQHDAGTSVMLLSLKAGGVGLNLTAADHVFLLDPWWNPAVEDQAADRAHRIGQEHPVFVHRLVAEDSVEERILELQQRKRAIAEAATEGTAVASLTRDDLLGLLS